MIAVETPAKWEKKSSSPVAKLPRNVTVFQTFYGKLARELAGASFNAKALMGKLSRCLLVIVASLLCVARAFAADPANLEQNAMPAEQAWAWYRQRPWTVGFNFVPSTAANTTEFWSADTFDEATIDRELGWGAQLGFNSCRVFVQYLVWKSNPAGLRQRLDRFLAIADRHGLATVLVLFDDCSFGDPPQTEPYLGKQRAPIPGMILPSWTPSPGLRAVTDRAAWPDLEKYIRDVVKTFGHDRRVLLWDLYNEPGNSGMESRSLPLVEATVRWARSCHPAQPITVGVWAGFADMNRRQIELSDVITFHFYGDDKGLAAQIDHFKRFGRPVINTEWMARPKGSRWETDLPLFKREGAGCFSWGLVNGRTQCQFAWSDKRGALEPAVWFHDLFHQDGTPYDPAEHAAIRLLTKNKAIDWNAVHEAGLKTTPPNVAEDGMKFFGEWTRWTGEGPRQGRLFYANSAGNSVAWETRNKEVTLMHKAGPDCGVLLVLIDGEPMAQVDTYSPAVDWNRRTRLARQLPAGAHLISLVTLGIRNEGSSNTYVQIVDFE